MYSNAAVAFTLDLVGGQVREERHGPLLPLLNPPVAAGVAQ